MNDDLPEMAPHTVLFAKVRSRLSQVPFEPFRIITTSGAAYEVPTADHAGVTPILRVIHIGRDDGSEVDLHALHVASIESLPHRAA